MNSKDPRSTELSPAVLDLSGFIGLTESEANQRLLQEGANELPSQDQRTVLRICLDVAREPMFLMLVSAGILYLLMGEPTDALMLLGFVIVVMLITIVQERRTENALEALRDMASPRALVIRGGNERRIAGREVARGDIVILREGDRVPADGILRRSISLSVDESLLTGESVPVRKRASPINSAMTLPGGDDLPSVYSGTLITAGQGICEVMATGQHSQLGKIGKSLQQLEPEDTPLQKETGRLVRFFAVAGLCACSVVVVTYALTRGATWQSWKEGLLAGIAMAMAILPEEFPVVLTVFLALGAWRISRSGVLTRRMPAVETLGAATVLCVDKTGTLTLNNMTLRRLWTQELDCDLTSMIGELPEPVHNLLEYAILASQRDPFDPMERALVVAGDHHLKDTEHLHPDWALKREYELTPAMLAMSHIWLSGDDDIAIVASKGAPEAIADLCHLPEPARLRLQRDVERLAASGLRVLAVAQGTAHKAALTDEQHDLKLDLVGLLGFEDPLRPEVPQAVAECQGAGIRVVMITGDYPTTAQSIAREAGILRSAHVMTGTQLDQMSDAELAQRITDIDVFARVVPEQKLRLVTALKANGEVVAMTGDGVNDAPALKAAHIGVAMGGRGTDVAREAAALVLVHDDFSSIVAAVRLGRRIYDNIKKAMIFVIAVHIPIIGLSMLPVFFAAWPLILLPVHIVFLELIIDPSCSLIFEAEESEGDLMRRPPRRPTDRLFSRRTLIAAVGQGFAILAMCLAVFFYTRQHHSPDAARALTFVTLVAGFLTTITANRSWSRSLVATVMAPNAAFRWVIGGTGLLMTGMLMLPVARQILHFEAVYIPDIIACLAVGGGGVLVAALGFRRVLRPRA